MIKIGITGSLASGKSTVAKLISRNKYPIFSADRAVKNIYKKTIEENILASEQAKKTPDKKKK